MTRKADFSGIVLFFVVYNIAPGVFILICGTSAWQMLMNLCPSLTISAVFGFNYLKRYF